MAHSRKQERDTESREAHSSWKSFFLLALVSAISLSALLLHAARYYPFISDDALISLRYAERLLAGNGLTWNDGERVEGYSSLLWVLAAALLGLLGMDLIDAVRVLGFLGMSAAMLALIYLHAPTSLACSLPSAAASLALAFTGSISVWVVGGLEQGLVTGLLAWAVVLVIQSSEQGRNGFLDLARPGILLGLLSLARPDGALYTATLALGVWIMHGLRARGLGRGLLLSAIPAGLYLAQLAFRLLYYGHLVPNTAHAKFAWTAERLFSGWEYLRDGALSLLGLLVPALLAVGLAVAGRLNGKRALLTAIPLVGWAAYVVLIGGDIFPGWRHFAPIAVLASFLAAELWSLCARSCRRRVRSLGWIAAAVSLAVLLPAQLENEENKRAIRERWEWEGLSVGNFLRAAFGDRAPLIAADPAGCIPFFSKLPAIDMLGLNDRHMATHPPPDLGHGWLGHELGDGVYVLDREPDLVLFCLPRGRIRPCFRSGRQMVRDPRFEREYLPVRIAATDPIPVGSLIWMRRQSPKVGIRREEGRTVVPGHLFARPGVARATLDKYGRVGVFLDRGRSATLDAIGVTPGTFRTRVESSGSAVQLAVMVDELPLRSAYHQLWDPGKATTVAFRITAGRSFAAHVREIAIERADN